MRRLASFLALPAGDRLLLLRAFAALALARAALHLVSTERLRGWASRFKPGTRPVERVAWAVSTASRLTPGTTCLASAFALQRLLSVEGHASELHIGVAKREQRLAAHAWVVCGGRTLIGEYGSDGYTHLLAWRVAEPSGGPAAGSTDRA
jgi:hypothetical protein